ncbi:tail fiber domain-containing protein, partial [bacterium]|nr:tail fiber domain-containing protein [bacterium]
WSDIAGSSYWTLSGTKLYPNNTGWNVGIGTTNPGAKLDVQGGDIKLKENWIREYNSGTSDTGLGIGHGSSGSYFWAGHAVIGYNYGTTTTGKLAINGNVGIGTTNPGYKLDVSGTIRAKDVFGAGGKNLIIGDDTYLTDIDQANMLGVYGMQNKDRAGIRLGSDGSYIFGDNGNIGIGTTSPTQKLEISGGNIQLPNNYGIYFRGSSQGNNAARIYTTSSSNRLFIRAEDTNNVAQFASYGLYLPRDPGISLYVGGDISIGYSSTSDNDTLYFDRQAEYLRWENSNGRFVFSDDVRAADFCTTSGKCLSSVGSGISGSGSTNYIPKWTGSTSLGNSQIYDNGSRVGIGTTSPSYKLQVQGDIYANGGWIRVSGKRGIYFQSYGGGWYMTDSTYIRNYGSKRVYLNNYLYAPRMYDKNNTGYYVDPNSTSRQYRINTNILDFSSGADARTAADGVFFRYGGQASMAFDDWFYMYDSNDKDLTIKFNVDNGAVYAKYFYYNSDISQKIDIQPLNDSLNKILKLQGVSFNWKDTGEPSIGLVAQEVEEIFPEVVSGKEGEKTIDYGKLVAPLIEALKEQQKEIEELKAEIEELKLKIK